MRLFFHRLLVLCCLLFVSGLHWFVMQTVAWSGMLVMRSGEVGFVEAARGTFDGTHPCSLCRAVDEGRSDDEGERERLAEVLAKFQCVLPVSTALPAAVSADIVYGATAGGFGDSRRAKPWVPPPRVG